MSNTVARQRPRHDPWQLTSATIARVRRESPDVRTYELLIGRRDEVVRSNRVSSTCCTCRGSARQRSRSAAKRKTGCCDTRSARWGR